MKIAVTSQDRRTVTPHAGKCRRFLVFEAEAGEPGEGRLVELGSEETLHGGQGLPAALAGIDALIAGSMGEGLAIRLARLGVRPVIAAELEARDAVGAFLAGRIGQPGAALPACGHDHDHDPAGGCSCHG